VGGVGIVREQLGLRLGIIGSQIDIGHVLEGDLFGKIPVLRGGAGLSAMAITPAAAALAASGTVLLEVPIIGWFDIRDMEEAVAADAEIDKGSLDARFDIHDSAFVDIADVTFVTGAFNIQFLENAILHNGNPAFLGLQYVN
jgi:hypothetical protein